MARLPATAAFLLLISLLVVAHCRAIEADPATDTGSTAVVAVDDETRPPNPTLPAEVVDTEQHGFLRLPSHRRHSHHPCRHSLFHRHLWWARHHGILRDEHQFHRHGEQLREAELEAMPVAEPDPDRSLPDSNGDGELTGKPFHDGEDGDDAAVKRWKEMLWRMFRHGLRHHRHHHHHFEEEDHEHEEEGAEGMKRVHHHADDEDEEAERMRKRFRHAEHDDSDDEDDDSDSDDEDDDSDSDNEDDEVEEMVRRFKKAIMRRRFGHSRRFHHHRHHGRDHRSEEDEKADGEQEQEGGVMTWIKGLMNRF